MLGKKSSEKSEKNVFLYSHEYRYQKMGATKRAKQFFQKYTNSASKKCWEKNRRKKVRKTYFYIHTNTVNNKIWGGKNARNNFSRITLIVRAKNGKKIVGKSAKNVFYIHTNIVTKKWGGKNARNNF